MEKLKVIALTHKTTELENIGKLHLEDTEKQVHLESFRQKMNMKELMYLSTCNRVEFIFVGDGELTDEYLLDFFHTFKPSWGETELAWAIKSAVYCEGEKAVEHLFNVASSIDSMVIGEREIITQVRNAYEECSALGLTGDYLRLLIKKTIETAKEVYTNTDIARKPVSVVSLAYHQLVNANIPLDARFVIIGAGQTNTNMAKFLKKHGFKNFVVFNRTLANAEKLASDLDGRAFDLNALNSFKEGFDVIVTCTAAAHHIIDDQLYASLLNDEGDKKIVIDLAIPNDFHPELHKYFKVRHISVEHLKVEADKNLKEREKELVKCMNIIERNVQEFRSEVKIRQVELAMREVPEKVKEIKEKALNSVFQNELENLDETSREVVDKILAYMEKKYISVPMKMAREIMVGEEKKGHTRKQVPH